MEEIVRLVVVLLVVGVLVEYFGYWLNNRDR